MEKANKIKAMIFDGEGMVIIGEKFYMDLIRDYGPKAEELNKFFANEFQLCLIGKADLKEEIGKYLEAMEWKGDVDEFLNQWFRAEKNIDEQIVAKIGELRASGVKCYIATNQEKHHAAFMRTEMGFDKIFDKVFFSCDIGYIKPQKEFYGHIASQLAAEGITAPEVIFWDDRKKNVEESSKLGFISQMYESFDNFMYIYSMYLP